MSFELKLDMSEGLSCIWLKEVYASDNQPTEDTLLAILGWLPRPRIENLMTFAALNQLSSLLHAFRCDTSIFSKCTLFPYKPRITNTWFSHSLKDKRENIVKVINVNSQGKKDKCYKTQDGNSNFPYSLSNAEYELFFHGTNHDSAKDIIESGIDLNKGREKKDFSDGSGFYVGKDLADTMGEKWACHRLPCSAALVFRVRVTDLRDDMKGLDLQDETDTWEEVVHNNRTGNRTRKFLKKYQDYDFIEGPMAGEGQNFRYPYAAKDSMYQLCVKSLNCARLFDKSLHSALFLGPP